MTRRWIAAMLAALVAIGAGLYVAHLSAPPPTVWVPFVTAPVPAGTPVTAADIQWRQVIQPPATAFEAPASPVGLYATHALAPGEALAQSDVGAARQVGAKPGEVTWYATIASASASGLATVGSRVDVWAGIGSNGSGGAIPQLLATGVRVLGLYTATGQPETPTTTSGGSSLTPSTSTAGELVALAVPAADMPIFLAAQGLALVVDPAHGRFHLQVAPPKGA